MKKSNKQSRRRFVKKLTGTTVLASTAPLLLFGNDVKSKTRNSKPISANDRIGIAVIGAGIMGFNNLETALKVPGVELIAGCDLYDSRLKRLKELYGSNIFTTRNYKEILDRGDVDAVIIATTDHWHDKISIDSMNSGKAVYCEKPMVHHLEEGLEVIEVQKKTQQVFQVGSQRVSSVTTLKAKQLYEAGHIGQLNLVEAWNDRHSAIGAWQYSIPPNVTEQDLDWDTFLGDAPKVPFDPVRFFRWRNYQDYGTGVAGDLFVHLFSGLHAVTSSLGPERIYASGGLRLWKDGRDVPDIISGVYDYPATDKHSAFNVQMRVNFVDGSGGGSGLRLVGDEGAMTIGGNGLSIKRHKLPKAPGFGGWDSFKTFDSATQKEFKAWYKETYPAEADPKAQGDINFKKPRGQNDDLDHHKNFFNAIREGAPIVEDASFGLRAAGPALASNMSYFNQKVIHWDPEKMTVLSKD